MMLRLVVSAYFIYLIAPIALLIVGSFGARWTNTLLPTGFTTGWFVQLTEDPSFRRAFVTSLTVAGATCAVNGLIGVPLSYAIHNAARSGVRQAARIVSLMPIAAFGFILVFSSDTLPFLGSVWLLVMAHVVLTLPTCSTRCWRIWRPSDLTSASASPPASAPPSANACSTSCCPASATAWSRPHHGRGHLDRRVPALEFGL